MSKQINKPVKETVMIKLEFTTSLWERQGGEPAVAFSAFTKYRDMGPERTLVKLAAVLGKSHENYTWMSQKYRWKERILAWVDELDKRNRDAQKKEVREMAKRHAQQAVVYQVALQAPMTAFLKRIQADAKEKDFEELNIGQLYDKVIDSARAFSNVVDVERKSRGEATEISKQDVTSGGERIQVILPTLLPGEEIPDED